MKKSIHLRITGHVQGVYYRLTMQKMAVMQDVTGWVRNLGDGSVEAIIQGSEDNLKRVLEWCAKGPDEANVENVESKEIESSEFVSFDIRD